MKHIPIVALFFLVYVQVAYAQQPSAEPSEGLRPANGLAAHPTPKNYLKFYLGFDLAQRYFLEQATVGEPELNFQLEYSTAPFYALAFARESADGDFWEISGHINLHLGGRQSVYREDTHPDSIPFTPADILGGERNRYAQMQYEYNLLLSRGVSAKVRPYLGIFVRGAAQWADFEPSTSANFPKERWRVFLTPGFVPRLLLFGSKRLHIDLSAPVTLGYFGVERSVIRDPLLTAQQQRSTTFDLSMVNLETQIRFGVVYQLGRLSSE